MYSRLSDGFAPYLTWSRQELVSLYENWWEKYRVSMREIEAERDEAKERLDTSLRELGYTEYIFEKNSCYYNLSGKITMHTKRLPQ